MRPPASVPVSLLSHCCMSFCNSRVESSGGTGHVTLWQEPGVHAGRAAQKPYYARRGGSSPDLSQQHQEPHRRKEHWPSGQGGTLNPVRHQSGLPAVGLQTRTGTAARSYLPKAGWCGTAGGALPSSGDTKGKLVYTQILWWQVCTGVWPRPRPCKRRSKVQ